MTVSRISRRLSRTSHQAGARPVATKCLLPSISHVSSSSNVRTPGQKLQRAQFTSGCLLRAPKPLTGDPKRHDTNDFSEGLTGNCLCGSITVRINDNELFTKRRGHLCHCANCRKVAGSFVSSNLIIEEEKVTITDRDGTLKEYMDHETGSGNPLGRFFCGGCGNPIKSVVPALEGKVIIKMGMFPRIPRPEFETFGAHRHPWQGHHPEMPTYKLKAREALLEE